MKKPLLMALAVCFTYATGAVASDAIISERQAKFRESAGNLRAMRMHLQNADYGAIQTSAEAIAVWAEEMPGYFPDGSHVGKTNAKPAIWDRFDEFSQLADDNKNKALALAEAAASGDANAVQNAMQTVGRTCGACHSQFKK